jgi:hypothetical protein
MSRFRDKVFWFSVLVIVVALGFLYATKVYDSAKPMRHVSDPPAPKPPTSAPQTISPEQGLAPERSPFIRFPFDTETLFTDWKEKAYKGKTSYEVLEDEDGENILKALSSGTSSGWFKDVVVDMSRRPFLTWSWKVATFPSNKVHDTFDASEDNDFGARVYAIFKGKLPLSYHVIQYVWDDHYPEGTVGSSPFGKGVHYLVVENGKKSSAGEWITEQRDLVRDYEMLFGTQLQKDLVAIGVMSDSDNTGTETEAYFRNLAIELPAVAR